MVTSRLHTSTSDYYERHAAEYAAATIAVSMASYTTRFASLLPSNALVLDLGCGSGRDLRALSMLGCTCVGLDLSPPLAHFAAQFSARPVVVGDMRAPPFRDRSFMGVWASASLLHLRRGELRTVLGNCRRLLPTNGVLFTSMKPGRGEGYDSHGRWYSYVTKEEWSSLLVQTGFSILSIEDGGGLEGAPPPWITSFSRAV